MPNSAIAKAHPEWLLRDKEGRAIKAAWNPNWGGDVWALDLSRSDVEDYLVYLFDTIVNVWGYRYFKLDFLYAGLMQGVFSGRKGGAWQHYARIMARILEFSQASNGEHVAFLSCGAPIESTAPFMPLMRSGADTREHWEWLQLRLIGHQGRPSAKVNLEDSIGRAILDKTLLLCDPDVIFCRTDLTSLKDTEKFLIGMVAAMFGSQLMTSDDPARFANDAGTESESGTDALSEAAFTKELIEWYKRIEGKEFGVERNPGRTRALYDFFSRDGSIYGAINLSDREQLIVAELSESSELSRLSEWSETSESAAIAPSSEFPIPCHSMIIFGT
jgi:alpha-galactosidase